MNDLFGRNIHYLRISITDRCNLRCRYCMPDGVAMCGHDDVLRYEEFLRLARLFARMGITHMRVTGGEPLVRKHAPAFISELKRIPGINTVSMTTNGILLPRYAKELKESGLDSVNISLDTTDEALSEMVTGCPGTVSAVREGIAAMEEVGIPVKLNAVLLRQTAETIADVAAFAKEGIPVRFIELMPLGCGKDNLDGVSAAEALERLRNAYPDLRESDSRPGVGPARYFESSQLRAPIGIIDAVSHSFCTSCNRVRLTSTGALKPCLCFEEGAELGQMLRAGATDDELLATIESTIRKKPREHCFADPEQMTENRLMSQIGG